MKQIPDFRKLGADLLSLVPDLALSYLFLLVLIWFILPINKIIIKCKDKFIRPFNSIKQARHPNPLTVGTITPTWDTYLGHLPGSLDGKRDYWWQSWYIGEGATGDSPFQPAVRLFFVLWCCHHHNCNQHGKLYNPQYANYEGLQTPIC